MMRWAPLGTMLLLSSCGSNSSGQLQIDMTISSSRWVALDLASRTVTPVAEPVDASAPRWQGGTLLFRELDPGVARVGRAVADTLAEPDEYPPRRVGHGRVWIAANELNQRQWRLIAGTEPWFAVLPLRDQRPFVGDSLPALGLTPESAETACDGFHLDSWTLDLPLAAEWERACAAGGTARFTWGDELDASKAVTYAVCDATSPQPIGGRTPNAWGLHDMHGNVWELVRSDSGWEARGGGWDQPVATARISNHLPMPMMVTGWSIGLRPVLRR